VTLYAKRINIVIDLKGRFWRGSSGVYRRQVTFEKETKREWNRKGYTEQEKLFETE
jgi:hypothetical protein